MITEYDEHANEQVSEEGTQDQQLSFYPEDEKSEIEQDLSRYFEGSDMKESRTTSRTVLFDQRKHPSMTSDYTLKIEEALRRREKPKLETRGEQQSHRKSNQAVHRSAASLLEASRYSRASSVRSVQSA